MKTIVYVAFEVEATNHQEARNSIKESLQAVDNILADTILGDGKEKIFRKVLGSSKIVDHVKF